MNTTKTQSENPCPLCNQEAEVRSILERDIKQVRCERCGRFDITDELQQILPRLESRHLIAGVTREMSERRSDPLILQRANIEQLRKLAPANKDVSDKSRRLLLALARRTRVPGKVERVALTRDYPLAYAQDSDELRYYLRHLAELKLARITEAAGVVWDFVLTPKGWDEVSRAEVPNLQSERCFVAMWFDRQMDSAYHSGIQPALEDDCGYTAIRVDEQEYVGKVDDRIIAEIRESRFVVADVTGQRQGVYYEAGYAQGMGLPIIWTCREDEIGDVHFDTRQQNHIVWSDPADLRERLKNRIRAVIGRGPRRTGC